MNNPSGLQEIGLTVFGGANLELQPTDLPTGLSPDPLDVAFIPGSVFTRPPLQRFSTLGKTTQIVYNSSFTKPDGTVVQLAFDSAGGMYADGVKIGQTAAGNRFQTCNVFGRVYIATSDGLHGADVPLQYDGTNLDRVSQDGPGAAPTFGANSSTSSTYAISTIVQPVAKNWTFAFGLQSSGPGSTASGTVITQYYADSTVTGQDNDLVTAFNSGNPTYVAIALTNAPGGMQTPNTVLVTGVGRANPPGESRAFYYFTYNVPTSQALYGSGHGGYGIHYQRTLATVTLSVPAPLVVGRDAVITGASVAAWDATWPITQTLDSGEMSINQSSLASGTATFSYSVVSGANPTNGKLVTITGTLNANGTLNVVNLPISGVSGTSTGTFQVAGLSAVTNYPVTPETGAATTEGEQFAIEPGALTANTANSPIYGYSTGGTAGLSTTDIVIAPGKRQGVVIFQTRTGYQTIPSPGVTFFIPQGTTSIVASNIPIGPANVVARVMAFTGANGGKFFYLPVPALDNGVPTGTSTVVNDNTSTSMTLNFTDQALLAATAIDIPGNNLFRQVVLGPCLGFFPYAGRLFAWGERNKVQQFLNMGFEGGYDALDPHAPLGWTYNVGSLASGDYGAAFQFADVGDLGSISQPAFQDQYSVAILQPNTQYTFRLWAYGLGTVSADLYSPTAGIIATVAVEIGNGFVEGNFGNKTPLVIPPDTVLKIYSSAVGTIIDELEIYYTDNPYLTYARASYINNLEAFDGVTGILGPASDPQPVMAFQERRDVLNLLTYGPNGSLYETEDTASGEPVTWNLRHVSSECGIISTWGIAKFEDWFCWTSDTGLRIYDGGTVDKMSQEVQPMWDSFNPAAKQFTVLANDPELRRIYLLFAKTSTVTDTTWVLDYRELNTASALANAGSLRVSYTGKMITTDMTRKWCQWSMTMNYCGMIALQGGGSVMTFCGGTGVSLQDAAHSAIYTLDEGSWAGVDADYGRFWDKCSYPTYFFISTDDAQQRQLGSHRLLHAFASLNVNGYGSILMKPMLDRVGNYGRFTPAVAITPDLARDIEFGLNLAAERISYRICAQPQGKGPWPDDAQAGFSVSSLIVGVKTMPFSPIRGFNG